MYNGTNFPIPDSPCLEALLIDTALIGWLQSHNQFALALVFFFAFAEACIGIGLFISGLFLVTISSWLYTSGAYGLSQLLPLAFAGATLGDHTGFHFGYRFGPRIHASGFVRSRRKAIERVEQLILKYGTFAVFVGRLVPAIRSLLPAILGASRFDPVYFSVLDLVACAVWALGLGIIISGVDSLL